MTKVILIILIDVGESNVSTVFIKQPISQGTMTRLEKPALCTEDVYLVMYACFKPDKTKRRDILDIFNALNNLLSDTGTIITSGYDSVYETLSLFKMWQIARTKLTLQSKLGEGQFGVVYRGELIVDEDEIILVAVKQMKVWLYSITI